MMRQVRLSELKPGSFFCDTNVGGYWLVGADFHAGQKQRVCYSLLDGTLAVFWLSATVSELENRGDLPEVN